MNYFDLINEFLDGSLREQSENSLFTALAEQPELRTTLKHAILLMLAVRRHAPVAPPTQTTNAVFTRLGFASPTTIATPTSLSQRAASNITNNARSAAGKAAAGLGGFWSKYRQALITAPVTALITILLLWQYGNIASTVLDTSPSAQTSAVQIHSNTPASDTIRERVIVREIFHEVVRNAPKTASSEFQAQALPVTDTERIITQQETKQQNDRGQENSTLAYNIQKQDSMIAAPEAQNKKQQDKHTDSLIKEGLRGDATLENNDTYNHMSTSATITDFTKPSLENGMLRHISIRPANHLSIEIRGNSLQSLPQATIEPGNPPAFNNTVINASYMFADGHSLGIEAGQGSFFQRFFHQSENELLYITQNPVLVYAGAAYRYTMFPESITSPIGQVVLGGTRLGPLGRMMLGISYAPDSRTQFILGAEANLLLYGNQGTWYTSQNAGFTYGVSIRF